MRYIRDMEHTDIAHEFNWTESRYRWFWGNLTKKLLVLCDLRHPPYHFIAVSGNFFRSSLS